MTDESSNLYNRSAELFVLCNTMYARDGGMAAWAAVSEHIKSPAYFYDRNNALIAMVIADLWAKNEEPDAQAVINQLSQVTFNEAMQALTSLRNGSARERPRLDPAIGYEDSLAMAIGCNHPALSDQGVQQARRDQLTTNAKVVADHWRQRMAIELLSKATTKLSESGGRSKAKDIADAVITDLCNVVSGRSGVRSMADHTMDAIQAHDAVKHAKPKPKPLWGVPSIDKICRFRSTGMTVLAGTPGTGKTSLALQCASATAEHIGTECSVGIVSREMPGVDLARILMARALGVDRSDIEEGRLTELQRADAELLTKSVAHGRGIVIHDSFHECTAKSVCAWARQLHSRSGGTMALLVVDHLQLLSAENGRQSEYEKLSGATHALKNLALELGITVLLLSQLNNASQKLSKGNPGGSYGAQDFGLTDLRGSGTIGQDADQVIILCNQQPGPGNKKPVIKVKGVKNRWGPEDSVDCIFDRANGQQYRDLTLSKGSQYERMESKPLDDEDLF